MKCLIRFRGQHPRRRPFTNWKCACISPLPREVAYLLPPLSRFCLFVCEQTMRNAQKTRPYPYTKCLQFEWNERQLSIEEEKKKHVRRTRLIHTLHAARASWIKIVRSNGSSVSDSMLIQVTSKALLTLLSVRFTTKFTQRMQRRFSSLLRCSLALTIDRFVLFSAWVNRRHCRWHDEESFLDTQLIRNPSHHIVTYKDAHRTLTI